MALHPPVAPRTPPPPASPRAARPAVPRARRCAGSCRRAATSRPSGASAALRRRLGARRLRAPCTPCCRRRPRRRSLRRFRAPTSAPRRPRRSSGPSAARGVRGDRVRSRSRRHAHLRHAARDLVLPTPSARTAAGHRLAPRAGFPGLRPGEPLARETELPPRATIQARDGTAIAQGAARLSRPRTAGVEIAGQGRARRRPTRAGARRRGVPPARRSASPGSSASSTSGCRHAGRDAERRPPRARGSEPRRGGAVRTTIDPRSSRPRSRRSPAATAGSR